MPAPTGRDAFASTLGAFAATVGSAIGLGNIWKFPYLTGSNGGAAFVLTYLLAVALVGIPVMAVEHVIGRRMRLNAVHAYARRRPGPAVLVGDRVGRARVRRPHHGVLHGRRRVGVRLRVQVGRRDRHRDGARRPRRSGRWRAGPGSRCSGRSAVLGRHDDASSPPACRRASRRSRRRLDAAPVRAPRRLRRPRAHAARRLRRRRVPVRARPLEAHGRPSCSRRSGSRSSSSRSAWAR